VNKVLVIDDDPVITKVYKKQFELAKFTVHVAHDGIEGFVALQTFKPDVVVLDLKMPFRNGADWLANIRGMPKYRDLPVVVVTAEPPDSPEVKALAESDRTNVLFKSHWSPEAMVTAVNWVLTRKR
jgi:CheY-like chemotaxis protein